jgi:ATP-dependent RNA helicase DHX57
MGPNRGGGRRTGGGGHQAGQNAMDKAKLKKEKEKAAKRGSRAEAAERANKPEFLQSKTTGKGSGTRPGAEGRGVEEVVMSANCAAMVTETLRRLDVSTNAMPRVGSSSSVDVRHDVDREDVLRKAAQAIGKKGFSEGLIERALAATRRAADVERDACEGFNEQKRRAIARAMDWLILNADKNELPAALRPEVKGKTKGKGGDEAAAKDDAEGAIEAFVRAGFTVDAARTAMRGAKGDVSRALDDLCAALGPSREEALAEAMEAFADTGADSASEDDIREVLRNAQYDELSELPRDLYKQRGYNPASGTASMAVDIAGIVALGAAKQYAADFYVSFKDAPLYPFELPRLSFSHPTLDTERSIAVSVAMMRHAASLVGQPMIDDIIEWLQGSGPLEAIEEARERAMAPALEPAKKKVTGAKAIPAPKGGILAPPTQTKEERKRELERRRELAAEAEKTRARVEAQTEAEAQTIAEAKTKKLAEAILKEEEKRANDPRVIAESERLKTELTKFWNDKKDSPILKQRQRLPAWAKQQELIDAVERNQVLIVAGETGCGKTTQLPQFILDNAIWQGRGAMTNMICTQPRRISATSVASRVASERGEQIGKTVGYKIRLEGSMSSSTRILFCTTGVLLRRLTEDPLLSGTSHVIVDEVHERSLDSDFLLVLLRDILPHRPTLKVVLMSATLNALAFEDYFKGVSAVSKIPGFTYPVNEHYLEDILQVTEYQPNPGTEYFKKAPRRRDNFDASSRPVSSKDGDIPDEDSFNITLRDKGYGDNVVRALRNLEQGLINYELMTLLISHICESMDEGAILVFMPGLAEITKLYEACGANPTINAATSGGKYLIALHSTLSTAEQSIVFDHAPDSVRKIVIATNIAETSITIDDVVYVVDSGKCKENGYDPNTRMQLLLEQWVSRASARQRRGRAGRVQAGRCFRMYTRHVHDTVFAEHTLPEIRRVPLEGLCLQIQLQRMAGGIAGFLGKALEPPKVESVEAAVASLKRLGALDERECLTPLGQHLATLPVDVRVGKMLLYGSMLGCLDPVLTIAAVLSGRSPFVAPLDKRDEADLAKKLFAEDQSDHLTILNAYNGWQDAKKQGRSSEFAFTRENFLSWRALEGIADLRNQFTQLLNESGFLGSSSKKKGGGRYRGRQRGNVLETDVDWIRANRNSENKRLLKSVLVAGLYPNLIKVDPGSRPDAPPRLSFLAENGRTEKIQIHPSSINFEAKKFITKWLVYHERVQTTAIFVRDCTAVTPYQLLLFGGKIEVQHTQGTISIDRWATFQAPAKVGVLLKEIRNQLDRVLAQKIENVGKDVGELSNPLVLTILELLDSEKIAKMSTKPN